MEDDLAFVKKTEINILKYLNDVCEENGINYFLYYGSLLGAVRHKGMIPWDDDIDIALLRDDYEKLINVLMNNNSESIYKVFTNENNDEYYYPFAKVIDSTSYIVEHTELLPIENYGVFVDIFVLDRIPNSKFLSKIIFKKREIIKKILWYSVTVEFTEKNFIILFLKKCLRAISKIFNRSRLIQKYDGCYKKYNHDNKNSRLISNWCITKYEKHVVNANWFTDMINCSFDGINAKIPSKYDDILRVLYGDYLKLPPKEMQIPHHFLEVGSINEK